MTEQEVQTKILESQAMINELKAKIQPSTGYGDAQAQPQAAGTIAVTLPFSRIIDGKWLNWTETYQIADGADAFNALLDRNKAMGKPLNLKGGNNSQGGAMGKDSLNLILDIETTDAPAASVLLEMELAKPHAGTKDPAKKDKQVAAKKAKLQAEAALIEAAPVCIIGGIARHPFQLLVGSCGASIEGVSCVQYPTEEAMLEGFKRLLEEFGDVTFVGHNIEKDHYGRGFDLPHLRFRYAFHGIPIPAAIDPFHTRYIELMELWFKANKQPATMVKLEEIALRLGITSKPFPLTGKDIPALWQAGDVDACLLKNYYDLLLTQQVFTRLHHA